MIKITQRQEIEGKEKTYFIKCNNRPNDEAYMGEWLGKVPFKDLQELYEKIGEIIKKDN